MVVGTSYAALSSTQDTMVASCWEDLELKVRYHKTDEEKEPREVQQCLYLITLNVAWGFWVTHSSLENGMLSHTFTERKARDVLCPQSSLFLSSNNHLFIGFRTYKSLRKIMMKLKPWAAVLHCILSLCCQTRDPHRRL